MKLKLMTALVGGAALVAAWGVAPPTAADRGGWASAAVAGPGSGNGAPGGNGANGANGTNGGIGGNGGNGGDGGNGADGANGADAVGDDGTTPGGDP